MVYSSYREAYDYELKKYGKTLEETKEYISVINGMYIILFYPEELEEGLKK